MSSIDREALPVWARSVADAYLSGAASLFLLHSNVLDLQLYKGELLPLRPFLVRALLGIKDTIVFYNVSEGIGFADASSERSFLAAVGRSRKGSLPREPADALLLLEGFVKTGERNAALVIDYVDRLAPSTPSPAFLSPADRMTCTTLQRWALDPRILQSDTIIVLVAEHISDVADAISRSPQVRAVKIPLPGVEERSSCLELLLGTLPGPDQKDTAAPFSLATLTSGLTRLHLLHLIREARARGSALSAGDVSVRKTAIIEAECAGLVELVRPLYGLDAVAGMESAKQVLRQVIKHVGDGEFDKCPMGIAFVGPMGTAKSFMATAFAGECGMSCLKFRNVYERWVGASEGNLARILDVVEALGPVVLIIDEVDRAMTGGRSEGDSGTSSRIYARLKEFMSDTSHRGRIITMVMSNRPDRVDPDIFRAGRIDLKIPFLFPETVDERLEILRRMAEKNRIGLPADDLSGIVAGMDGASGADIEAVVLLAARLADERGKAEVCLADLRDAATDYIPMRDTEMVEYMTLLAVSFCSSRRLLPEKFRAMTSEELAGRLREAAIPILRRG